MTGPVRRMAIPASLATDSWGIEGGSGLTGLPSAPGRLQTPGRCETSSPSHSEAAAIARIFSARSARVNRRPGQLFSNGVQPCSGLSNSPIHPPEHSEKGRPMSKVHLALSRYKTSPELRDSIERQAGEFVSSELNRCDEEWHAAVASVKDTVAVLERTCDGFLSKTHMTPSGAIQHLVDRIVKTASEEAERAAELVRAEARLQLASAEALTNRLEAE